jgi:methyl-accepting chemotaxis protein
MLKMINKLSLKVKLIGMTTGLVGFLGFASVLAIQNLTNSVERAEVQGKKTYATALSDGISAQYFERYGDVQAFAINPIMRSGNRDKIVDYLNQYSALYLIYDLIVVVDTKGKLIAATNKAPDGSAIKVDSLYEKSFADEPWFKSVMAGQFTEDKAKGFVGTYSESVNFDPLVETVYGKPSLGSSFSAPIKDEAGNVIAVISNRAGIRWIGVAFKEIYSKMKASGYDSTELSLLAKDGTLLFEYAPLAAGTEEFVTDPKVFTKLNLIETGAFYAKELAAGRTGAGISFHTRRNADYVGGWVPVDGPKFTASLGWGVASRASAENVLGSLWRMEKIIFGAIALVILLSVVVAFWFSQVLSQALSRVATTLGSSAEETTEASQSIAASSTELSESATEQAAAIQETASAIDQVSAMVKKSSDNAQRSQTASQSSRAAAEDGQKAVTEMIESIGAIAQANADIMREVEAGNRQFAEIVKVIEEIGGKTKVINDIVFQTKLLSFNASVEAARAGEHGKGFAVVAEEVGNLAQMSGNAAKEISGMLEGSISKVQTIVAETKQRVERFVGEGKSKVEQGTKVAERCGDVLGSILTSVQEVDGMVAEIATASREQSDGVSEINKAMNQLDQATQQNTKVAQMTASSSEQLSGQAVAMREMVVELGEIVYGASAKMESKSRERDSNKKEPRRTESKKPEVGSASGGEVVRLPRKKTTAGLSKKAVGSDLPAHDDPRFEEV